MFPSGKNLFAVYILQRTELLAVKEVKVGENFEILNINLQNLWKINLYLQIESVCEFICKFLLECHFHIIS